LEWRGEVFAGSKKEVLGIKISDLKIRPEKEL
jgi:hypothetical protein